MKNILRPKIESVAPLPFGIKSRPFCEEIQFVARIHGTLLHVAVHVSSGQLISELQMLHIRATNFSYSIGIVFGIYASHLGIDIYAEKKGRQIMFIVHGSECDYSTRREQCAAVTHHSHTHCVLQTFNSSLWCETWHIYFSHIERTLQTHTHGEQWTHILSASKWRFKGELRRNGGNNEYHQHTSTRWMDGHRCVPYDISRTKVNLVTAMFVYWRDTAADFTTNRNGLVDDGVGRLLSVSPVCTVYRWMSNVNDERSSLKVKFASHFYCLETENVFPNIFRTNGFCVSRFINICTFDVRWWPLPMVTKWQIHCKLLCECVCETGKMVRAWVWAVSTKLFESKQ